MYKSRFLIGETYGVQAFSGQQTAIISVHSDREVRLLDRIARLRGVLVWRKSNRFAASA